MDHSRQSNGLAGQVVPLQLLAMARDVPFTENQVQHMQNRPQAFRPLARLRQPKRDSRSKDRLLRPADTLRHGGFGRQKSARDLGGGQSADSPQR